MPAGSELIEATGVEPETLEVSAGEGGSTVFAGYLVVGTGERSTVTFTYRLPERIGRDGYELTVQRQSGTGPLPLAFTLDGAEPFSTTVASGVWTWPK